MTDVIVPPEPLPPIPSVVAAPVSERSQARRETLKQLVRRPAFLIGSVVMIAWVVTALLGRPGSRRTTRSTTSRSATNHRTPST